MSFWLWLWVWVRFWIGVRFGDDYNADFNDKVFYDEVFNFNEDSHDKDYDNGFSDSYVYLGRWLFWRRYFGWRRHYRRRKSWSGKPTADRLGVGVDGAHGNGDGIACGFIGSGCDGVKVERESWGYTIVGIFNEGTI